MTYTPTTEEVRDVYAHAQTYREFDRWLEAHDRETKAEAWQEGYRTSCQDHGGYTSCGTGDDPHSASRTNPYKEQP
jgi:hypothetical protein